jgi:hypothetical protein
MLPMEPRLRNQSHMGDMVSQSQEFRESTGRMERAFDHCAVLPAPAVPPHVLTLDGG